MVRRVRQVAGRFKGACWTLASLVCVVAGINLFAAAPYRVAGLDIRVSARVDVPGYSRLAIPPIGRVEARSHPVPLQLQATLENIDLEALQDVISRGEVPSSIARQFRRDAGRLLARFALKVILLATAGGALGAAVASAWRPRRALGGAVLGLVASCVLLGSTYATFDERRLASPRYEGVIEAAPWMLGLLDGSLLEVGEVFGSIEAITNNIRTLFDRAEVFRNLSSDRPYVRILHVSDIHNNPQAFDFVEQVVKSFQPDVIIDTGDITDFGTVAEAKMVARRIRNLGVPYMFVAGNHDSPEVLRVLTAEAGVVLLGDGTTTFRGIHIAGLDDPGGLRPDMSPASDEEMEKARERAAGILAANRAVAGIDAFATHDVRAAEGVRGKVSVILCGHDHRLLVSPDSRTVVVNAGTTGGAGMRGLRVEGGVPMSVALLHFSVASRTDDRTATTPSHGDDPPMPVAELVAVDTIRILGERQGFALERRVLESGDTGARRTEARQI